MSLIVALLREEYEMRLVETSLSRLHLCVDRFVVLSEVMRDVRALQAQIELRRRALRDIEVISCRLRPFIRCKKKMLHRRFRRGRVSRLRLADSYRAGNRRLPA